MSLPHIPARKNHLPPWEAGGRRVPDQGGQIKIFRATNVAETVLETLRPGDIGLSRFLCMKRLGDLALGDF
jgi:hypothetical protein